MALLRRIDVAPPQGRAERLSVSKSKKDSRPGAARESKKGKFTGEMNPELQEALEAIRTLLGASNAREAGAKYDVGRQVLVVQAKYGRDALNMLIDKLGCGKDVIYNSARVVKSWNEQEFAELLQRPGAKGMSLSFSHFVKLSRVKPPEVRAALVRKVLDDGLSVEETADLVKSGRVKNGSRRKQPLHREFTQLEMRSQKLVERIGKVLTELKKEETVASEVMSSLRNMAKLLGAASTHCASVAEQHEATSKRVLEQAEADAQHGGRQHEQSQPSEPQQEQPRSEELTQPSEPQEEHPRSEDQLPSSPEPTAGFLHVQKIDDPAEPQIEASAVKHQGD